MTDRIINKYPQNMNPLRYFVYHCAHSLWLLEEFVKHEEFLCSNFPIEIIHSICRIFHKITKCSICCYRFSTEIVIGNKKYFYGERCISDQLTTLKFYELLPLLHVPSIKSFITGYSHAFIITTTNEVYGYGGNSNGQLGLGHKIDQTEFTKLTFFEELIVKKIACGSCHTLFLTKCGKIFSCGDSSYGHLPRNLHTVPIQVNLSNVINIFCGDYHSVAITGTEAYPDKIYTWGANNSNQLGLSDTDYKMISDLGSIEYSYQTVPAELSLI